MLSISLGYATAYILKLKQMTSTKMKNVLNVMAETLEKENTTHNKFSSSFCTPVVAIQVSMLSTTLVYIEQRYSFATLLTKA